MEGDISYLEFYNIDIEDINTGEITTGDEIEIMVDVENLGEARFKFTVEFALEDEIIGTATIVLDEGEV